MPDKFDPQDLHSDDYCQSEKEIFLGALEIEDLSERDAWLRRQCGDNLAMRSNVESLLTVSVQDDLAVEPDRDLLARGLQEMAESDASSRPGDSITYFGDYELLGEIARGAMGVVFQARQNSLNRIVAVKLIRGSMLSSESEVRRFKAESEAAASLDHPHIVPIYEVGEHMDQHYFSMKLVEGGTLADRIGEFGKDTRGALRLMIIVARAIHHAHQHGILHRDLKPGNLLLDRDGAPHVTDFGLAKMMGSESGLTVSGQIMGTPFYMAPEQAAGDSTNLSTAADIYSLGAILFELLSGQPPFKGDSVLETLRMAREDEAPSLSKISSSRSIDRDLETIASKCLQKDPAVRYSSAGEFAEDMERWLAGEPISARPITTLERAGKWVRRKPIAAALVGVGALLILTLGVGGPVSAYRQKMLADRALASEIKASESQESTRIANERLERENYRFTIQLAKSRLSTDEAYTVPGLLWATKPELRGWEWGHLMAQCQLEEWSVRVGDDPVRQLDVTLDGKHFVAITDHAVSLWDAETREKKWEKSYVEKLMEVACHPDGDYVAISRSAVEENSAFDDDIAITRSEVIVLSGATGEPIHTYPPGYRQRFVFGRKANSFYLIAKDAEAYAKALPDPESVNGQAHLIEGSPCHLYRYVCGDWAESKVSVAARLKGLRNPSKARMRTDPLGDWIGVTRNFSHYDIYDSQSLRLIHTISVNERMGGQGIALDSESGRVITSNHNRVVECFPRSILNDIDFSEYTHESGAIREIALLPGRRSHIGATRNALRMVQDGELIKVIRHGKEISDMERLRDGETRVLLSDNQGIVSCWNLDRAEFPVPKYECYLGSQGQQVEIHPSMRYVMFRDHQRNHLFSTAIYPGGMDNRHHPLFNSNENLGHIKKGMRLKASLLPRYSPDGDIVVRGLESLQLFDHGSLKLDHNFLVHSDEIKTPYPPFDAAFDQKGDWIAVSGERGELCAIHRKSGRMIPAKFTTADECRLYITRDADLGIAYDCVNSLYAWRPKTGELLFKHHIEGICASIHPDGAMIAIGHERGLATLVDPMNPDNLMSIQTNLGRARTLEFSPDGKRLALSGDGGMELWDWKLDEALMYFETKAGSRDLTFSPDGMTLAYTGMNPIVSVRFALPWHYQLGDQGFYQAVEELFFKD